MAAPRVVVVGAGPAGVRAAETLVAAALRPTVVDEERRDGGQIYRRQPEGFSRSYAALYGTEAKRAAALHAAFGGLRTKIDYRPNTLAWNVADKRLYLLEGAQSTALSFDALVIASGATDRLMAIKGWHHAGVYSLGGAQIALKAQACAIGRRVIFLGTGPLLYLVAAQFQMAGAAVAAVLDTSPFLGRVQALPKLTARPGALWKGIALMAHLRASGVPLETGITPLEIAGDPERGVEAVSYRNRKGEIRTIACDAVALGFHLRPETQLADLAHCAFHFDAATRQWLPVIDHDGRSSVPGVYLAGDGARLLGADGAEAAGQLAALAALADAGMPVKQVEITALRLALARMDRFRRGIAEAFPWPAQLAAELPDDAVVCRCETLTVGEVRHTVTHLGAPEINRAKALSRVGMGRCQGRYCGHAAAEVVAAAAGLALERVGRLRGQAPVKPLPIDVEDATAPHASAAQ
jgi:NADPH-dependent 2,4-dienoyl-CoA reductase/sulfur reductase-like enzyme